MSSYSHRNDIEFDRKIAHVLSILQTKYLAMSELHKVTYINDLVKKASNDPNTHQILRNVRRSEMKKPFGTNMLVDAAYILFPTNATTP